MGGLGNQMFQYAFAKSFSLKRNVEFQLDLRWFYKAWRHRMRHKYLHKNSDLAQLSHAGCQLDVFNISYQHSIIRDLLSKSRMEKAKRISKNVVENGGQFNPNY